MSLVLRSKERERVLSQLRGAQEAFELLHRIAPDFITHFFGHHLPPTLPIEARRIIEALYRELQAQTPKPNNLLAAQHNSRLPAQALRVVGGRL